MFSFWIFFSIVSWSLPSNNLPIEPLSRELKSDLHCGLLRQGAQPGSVALEFLVTDTLLLMSSSSLRPDRTTHTSGRAHFHKHKRYRGTVLTSQRSP